MRPFVLGCWSVCTELGCSVRGMSWQWRSMRGHVMENLGIQHRMQQLQMKLFLYGLGWFLAFFWVDALQLFNSYCWFPWTLALDWRCFWWGSLICVKSIRKQSHHFRLGLSISFCSRNESELVIPPTVSELDEEKIGRKPKFAYILRGITQENKNHGFL